MSEVTATSIRLPNELHEKLKAVAEAENRTLNAQIITYLKQAVEPKKKAG